MSAELYHLLSEHLSEWKKKRFEKVAASRTRHICLILEDIYQAQNASAIFRSMESWGIQDLYVIENQHQLKINQRVAKGSAQWISIHRFAGQPNNTQQCLQHLKEKGYRIAATSLEENAIDMASLDIHQKTAIIMGTELKGISEEAKMESDLLIKIPTYGMTKSLNVSVAAAVLLQHCAAQLRKNPVNWRLSQEEQLHLKIEWAKKSIYWSEHIVAQYQAGLPPITTLPPVLK